ncbi:MAG: class I SAM-dependent methyltransferase [Hyphomonadaceae bacterium]|jgi:predicted O-methyltransferase YrrM|nr:class I SAM-dependent methyltransferase [Hyphomonadaceae bacterium]
MSQPVPVPHTSATIRSGIPAVDGYLDAGYATVPGMSSRFAAAICCGLMRIQSELGVAGPAVEVGPFEGRFFIALALALTHGETVVGIDLFDWPNPEVIDRFEANCSKHGVLAERRITWKADSRTMQPEALLAKLGGRRPRLIHIDGEHSRAALTKDLELATAVLAPAGVIVLDDMLHPGYPTLMVAVHEYLGRHSDMCVLAIIDRETVVAATKFVLCRSEWFKRYEAKLLESYQANVWPLGADFEPHWCLVLSLDTKLAEIT